MRSRKTKFQSTRPRGARQDAHIQLGNPFPVSIHAPAWGATSSMAGMPSELAGFNPRARVGRDPGPHSHRDHRRNVSIHAPAWGATLCH